jgi:hypothetical protein
MNISSTDIAEMILELAVGVNPSKYIPTKKHEQFELNEIDNYFNKLEETNLKNDLDFNNKNTLIEANGGIITHKPYIVDNIYLIVDISSLPCGIDEYMDLLYDLRIVLIMGGSEMSTIPMNINLFLANTMGKQIIETPTQLKIPCVSTNLFVKNGIPLYQLR